METGTAHTDRPRIEICVETFGDAIAAVAAGADRIEYCSALALGGLTPSPAAIEHISDIGAPCMVMIRPRPGNFRYEAGEISQMKREISIARAAGAAGVVFGAGDRDRGLDVPVLAEVMSACEGLQTTLHRVFDEVPDQFAALEQAVDLGFDRILTSGGASDALSGAERIGQLIRLARGRIGILPGAGITPDNARKIIAKTGAGELHASCKVAGPAADGNEGRVRVDPDRVRALHKLTLQAR